MDRRKRRAPTAAKIHTDSAPREGPDEAVPRDPDGAQFTVTSRREA
ncbi:hypothetical protein [Streptomyces sp. NPDC001275]